MFKYIFFASLFVLLSGYKLISINETTKNINIDNFNINLNDTIIKDYYDDYGLLHLNYYLKDLLILQKIYEGSNLTYIAPILLSKFTKPNIRLRSGKMYLVQQSLDTLEINPEIPKMNRSVSATGGFISRLSDTSYVIKTSFKDFHSDSVKVYLFVGCSLTDKSTSNLIADSLVLPIK